MQKKPSAVINIVNCLPLDSFQPQPDTFDSCRQSTVAHDSKIVEFQHQLQHMPMHNKQKDVDPEKCKQESKHKTHRTANYGLQTACRMPLILCDPASHVKNTQKAAYECIGIAYFKEFSDYMSF